MRKPPENRNARLAPGVGTDKDRESEIDWPLLDTKSAAAVQASNRLPDQLPAEINEAHALVRAQGLSWFHVIVPGGAANSAIAEKVPFALANIGALSMWERSFLYSVKGKRRPSEKQTAVLDAIVAKARGYAEAA